MRFRCGHPGWNASIVRVLDARHAGYSVEDRHYDVVGAALLDTLSRGLGSAFTSEVRGAWAAAYVLLAETMKPGAARRHSVSGRPFWRARQRAHP